MKDAITGFKDQEDTLCLPLLVHGLGVLADWLDEQDLPDDTLLLPMPTTHRRVAKRGFAPVELLARYLSSLSGLPIYHGVERVLDGVHQRGLGRQERWDNVAGAFALTCDLPSQAVVIFDDVATTGASMAAMAQAILDEYPDMQILAVCLAHGSPCYPSATVA